MRKFTSSFFGLGAGALILSCAAFFSMSGKNNVDAAVSQQQTQVVSSAESGDNQTMFQAYEWFLSNNGKYWDNIGDKASELSQTGFTSVWLPPAYKGMSGTYSVGYDPYDLYDLGEFNQMGTVRTKYGTKAQYISAIDELHANGIKVYADAVMNHKAGADSCEDAKAYKVSGSNRNYNLTSSPLSIKSWTVFNFPGRNGKYSTFKWDKSCFDGVDYDQKSGNNAIYRFSGKSWDKTDTENGNYDYLMYADIDLNSSKVRNELKNWGEWYVNTAKLDGFRLDAVKHMEFSFVGDWINSVSKSTGKDLFAVSEYYSGNVGTLNNYITATNGTTSLFDFPLYYKFKAAGVNYNLNQFLTGTLTAAHEDLSVTFVENHDTQIGQSDSTVKNWVKPLAYAFILTRQEGYPCVFYGDYYGAGNGKTKAQKEMIDSLMAARKHFAYGEQKTVSADNGKVLAWTRQGDTAHKYSGLAALITTSVNSKTMSLYVGKSHAGETWVDITGTTSGNVKISSTGYGIFKVNRASCAVYVNKSAISKYIKTDKVTGVKIDSTSTSTVRLTWNAVDNAKYNIYKYDAKTKKWVKVASATNNSVVVRNLASASKYDFCVKAYRTIGAIKVNGEKSSQVTVLTLPKTPTLKAKAGTGKVKLTWNKASSKATGYLIYMSTSKGGTYKQVAKITKASTLAKTIKNLKKGKTYYFKIKSYRECKVSGKTKTVKSSYSSKVYAKVK